MLMLLLVLLAGTDLVTSSAKKGYGMNHDPGYFRCDDTTTLTDATWWYDWFNTPKEFSQYHCSSHYKGEYVPMIWSKAVSLNIPPGAKYVLGYNEPNQKDQANMSPQDAATHWREIERVAHGKKLISPAPSQCHSGPTCNMGPTQWLDAFFAACKGCRVDYLGAHTYSCNAEADIRYLENLHHRYKKQIWLTEFACPHTSDKTRVLNYMKQILPRLENASFIYRYAWFASRWKVDGFLTDAVGLMERNSASLTPLGHFYNNFRHS